MEDLQCKRNYTSGNGLNVCRYLSFFLFVFWKHALICASLVIWDPINAFILVLSHFYKRFVFVWFLNVKIADSFHCVVYYLAHSLNDPVLK